MRLTPLVAALALLASQGSAQSAAAPSPIVGTWESLERIQGGMGSVMVFAADNSALAIVSVMVDARYTRNGNRIQVIDTDGSRVTYTVVVTGNSLVQTTREKTVRMTRVPGFGPDTGLLGKWRFVYEAPNAPPMQASMEYTADGINKVRMAVQSQAGTYSIAGNELTLRFPNAPTETRPFSIDGDVLTLQGPNGTRGRFTRAR